MRIGFTGTRRGLTPLQINALRDQIVALGADWFHHGDCVGADAVAHSLARVLGLRVSIHPPTDPRQRAFCEGADRVCPEEPYLDRNHRIVRETDVLIACPGERQEVLRGSGTWSTVRYARKQGRPVIIVLPEGVIGR
jgi:hypothetical protein